MKEVMQLVDQDLIGIPLFEGAQLYAVQEGINWEPRLDGLVLASEVQ